MAMTNERGKRGSTMCREPNIVSHLRTCIGLAANIPAQSNPRLAIENPLENVVPDLLISFCVIKRRWNRLLTH